MGWCASVAELPAWARRLLDSEPVGRLGFLDAEGAPRVLPVTFAIAGDDLVTAIDHKRKRSGHGELARVRWLRQRPRAALTVDHYEDDWHQLGWVQSLGTVEVLEAGDAPAALDALTSRYPQYREQPPAGPVLALTPRRLLWWRA